MASSVEERLSLADAASRLLDECRMVLPGIQALFGFQLVAVFDDAFSWQLSRAQQHLHYLAIGFVVLAIALIMAPAAYHRQTSPMVVTEDFIRVSTRLLLSSMFPLAAAISLDFYLVGVVIVGSSVALVSTVIAFLFIMAFWFALPRWAARPTSLPRRSASAH
jgi:hypothetical protein